jgi:ubiquitin C-terminal hydrolase
LASFYFRFAFYDRLAQNFKFLGVKKKKILKPSAWRLHGMHPGWHNGGNSCSMQYSMQCPMITLPDLTGIYLHQSFIKTAINTAITVKLVDI